jgi:hypothetical protein
MLMERNIRQEWVEITLEEPEYIEQPGDGTKHYIRKISENGNRWLRVIINDQIQPQIGITAFFDRRLKKYYANQG